MKKLLTTLWIVIIATAAFIAVQMFKPDSLSTPEETNPDSKPTQETSESSEIDTSELSGTYSEYLVNGDNAFTEANYSKAIGNYEAAVKLNPTSTDLLFRLANAYLLNQQPKEAKAVFETILEIDRTSLSAHLGIAESYLNLRDFENAKNVTWKLDPTLPEVRYYTGLILILHKDFEGAKKKFTSIIEDETILDQNLKEKAQIFSNAFATFAVFPEGNLLHLQTLLAKAFTDNGHYEPAIPLLYDIINQKNNYRDAWLILGYAYLNTNKIDDAVDALKEALALSPEKPETLFFLGLAYFSNNQTENAIYYLEEAKKFGFEPVEQVDLKLGDLYLLKKEFDQAATSYEAVIAKNVSNIEVFVKAVWLNIDELENYERALLLGQIALENHPENPMSYNLVGWAYTAQNDFKEARKYLGKALDLDPNFDAANLNLGWLYEKEGQKALAKEFYKKAYNLGNGNAVATLAAQRYNSLNIEIEEPESKPVTETPGTPLNF